MTKSIDYAMGSAWHQKKYYTYKYARSYVDSAVIVYILIFFKLSMFCRLYQKKFNFLGILSLQNSTNAKILWNHKKQAPYKSFLSSTLLDKPYVPLGKNKLLISISR